MGISHSPETRKGAAERGIESGDLHGPTAAQRWHARVSQRNAIHYIYRCILSDGLLDIKLRRHCKGGLRVSGRNAIHFWKPLKSVFPRVFSLPQICGNGRTTVRIQDKFGSDTRPGMFYHHLLPTADAAQTSDSVMLFRLSPRPDSSPATDNCFAQGATHATNSR